MEKNKIVFQFDRKTYLNFKDYGNAIVSKYYPFIVTSADTSAKFYYKAFWRVLENSTEKDFVTPSVLAAYNYCRWFYYALVAMHMKTDLILELYYSLHSKIEGRTLVDKFQEEAIIMAIRHARGF